jgi:hypothetical protein
VSIDSGRAGRRRRRHRAARPWPPSWLPAALVFTTAAVAMLRILTQHWREGAALLAAAMLVAAVLRVLLPDDRVGLLAVRSRVIDAAIYVGLGLVTLVLAVTITRGLGSG